jgi:hypothetical protein
MFYIKEDQVGSYQDLWAEAVAAAVVKGQGVVIQDCFCFYLTGGAIADRVVPIWECKQVYADKKIGTGQAILRGDEVYYDVLDGLVTATPPAGTIGTDFYFCGIAKQDADESDLQVWMSFFGDEYNHADRA